MIERRCAVCGKLFVASTNRQKYCSRDCYAVANRARAMARKEVSEGAEWHATGGQLDEMAQITASACRAVAALSRRQRMRLEILIDTEGVDDGLDEAD